MIVGAAWRLITAKPSMRKPTSNCFTRDPPPKNEMPFLYHQRIRQGVNFSKYCFIEFGTGTAPWLWSELSHSFPNILGLGWTGIGRQCLLEFGACPFLVVFSQECHRQAVTGSGYVGLGPHHLFQHRCRAIEVTTLVVDPAARVLICDVPRLSPHTVFRQS